MGHLQLPSPSRWPEEDSAPRTTPLPRGDKAKTAAKNQKSMQKAFRARFSQLWARKVPVYRTWASVCSDFWYLQGNGTSKLLLWAACLSRFWEPSPAATHVPIHNHELIVFLTCLGFWAQTLNFAMPLSEDVSVVPSPHHSTHRSLCALEFCSTVPWLHDQECSFSNFTSFLFTNDRSFLSAKPPSNSWFLFLGRC